MLYREQTALLVVDIQEKLFPHIHSHEAIREGVIRTIQGASILGIPVYVTEQYPDGLGPTVEEIRKELQPFEPIEKMSFSCLGEPKVLAALRESGRDQILLCGIEAHVCVYQTACDLLGGGFQVHLLTDCVSSRTAANRELAVRKLEKLGASLTSVEMVLFELMRVAGTPEFRAIAKLIK